MRLVELKNIKTQEVSVYYCMQYLAIAVYEILDQEINVPVSFSIEISPLGEKKIGIRLLEDVNYPLISLLRPVKKQILDLYSKGSIGS